MGVEANSETFRGTLRTRERWICLAGFRGSTKLLTGEDENLGWNNLFYAGARGGVR